MSSIETLELSLHAIERPKMQETVGESGMDGGINYSKAYATTRESRTQRDNVCERHTISE